MIHKGTTTDVSSHCLLTFNEVNLLKPERHSHHHTVLGLSHYVIELTNYFLKKNPKQVILLTNFTNQVINKKSENPVAVTV